MTSEDGFAVVDKANPQKGTVGQATQVGFTNVYSVESTKVENALRCKEDLRTQLDDIGCLYHHADCPRRGTHAQGRQGRRVDD